MKRSKPIILVIEDDMALLQAIEMKLKKSGFLVDTARSVVEAREKLEKIKIPAAVWLDHYLLGKENGLDFLAILKNSEQWKQIPVFIVSNTVSADNVRTYIQLGVEKYYVKSDCRLEKIISDINQSLEK